MLFGDLTFEEIRAVAENPASVIVIPTGCTEQQGPHLSVDFDTWLAGRICVAGAEWAARHHDVSALVLPTLPFGPTPEHRNFGSGFIDLPQQVHEVVIDAVLTSMLDQGFRRFVIWRGCGQHDLSSVADRLNSRQSEKAFVVQPELRYGEIWDRVGDPSTPAGHADSFATALALYLRSDHVRQGRIKDPGSKPVRWDDPGLDFAQYSKSGVIGDPTQASANLGERLWDEIVPHCGREIVAAARR